MTKLKNAPKKVLFLITVGFIGIILISVLLITIVNKSKYGIINEQDKYKVGTCSMFYVLNDGKVERLPAKLGSTFISCIQHFQFAKFTCRVTTLLRNSSRAGIDRLRIDIVANFGPDENYEVVPRPGYKSIGISNCKD